MGLKTAYRPKPEYLADKGPPGSEKIELNPEPPVDAVTVHHETDEATARLQRQIQELKKAEEFQRQAAMVPQRLTTRDEKLAQWRRQGLSEADERLFTENPQMIDYDRLTALAATEAAKHHPRGSGDHREATRQIFNEHLARLQTQATPAPAQPSPEFFRPAPPPEPPSRASIVSAPVSRGEVGSYRAEPSPSSVRLSPEEREIARASGISETQYAANKLKMLREQRSGESQR